MTAVSWDRELRREALNLALTHANHYGTLSADSTVEAARKFEQYLRDGAPVDGIEVRIDQHIDGPSTCKVTYNNVVVFDGRSAA